MIRLARGGRTHSPYYRVVVQDSRSRTRGPVIEELGVYHPCARPEPRSEVKIDRALAWLHEGAKPSATAKAILSKAGVLAKFDQGVTAEQAASESAAAGAESSES
ncbi:MAG: 30S ribosomal protein S16 [Candidatus Hydrogenedentales bacterium]